MEDYLKTPFTHHTVLLRKCKNNEERYYYMGRCVEERMSVPRLEQVISEGEYKKAGKAPNNFIERIEDKNLARKAVMQFKDSYLLDFINIEEIGERDLQDIDERVVEQQIVHNIKKFIMTFGKDFAFVGNQYHLEIYSEDFFPRSVVLQPGTERTGSGRAQIGQIQVELSCPADDLSENP